MARGAIRLIQRSPTSLYYALIHTSGSLSIVRWEDGLKEIAVFHATQGDSVIESVAWQTADAAHGVETLGILNSAGRVLTLDVHTQPAGRRIQPTTIFDESEHQKLPQPRWLSYSARGWLAYGTKLLTLADAKTLHLSPSVRAIGLCGGDDRVYLVDDEGHWCELTPWSNSVVALAGFDLFPKIRERYSRAPFPCDKGMTEATEHPAQALTNAASSPVLCWNFNWNLSMSFLLRHEMAQLTSPLSRWYLAHWLQEKPTPSAPVPSDHPWKVFALEWCSKPSSSYLTSVVDLCLGENDIHAAATAYIRAGKFQEAFNLYKSRRCNLEATLVFLRWNLEQQGVAPGEEHQRDQIDPGIG